MFANGNGENVVTDLQDRKEDDRDKCSIFYQQDRVESSMRKNSAYQNRNGCKWAKRTPQATGKKQYQRNQWPPQIPDYYHCRIQS